MIKNVIYLLISLHIKTIICHL